MRGKRGCARRSCSSVPRHRLVAAAAQDSPVWVARRGGSARRAGGAAAMVGPHHPTPRIAPHERALGRCAAVLCMLHVTAAPAGHRTCVREAHRGSFCSAQKWARHLHFPAGCCNGLGEAVVEHLIRGGTRRSETQPLVMAALDVLSQTFRLEICNPPGKPTHTPRGVIESVYVHNCNCECLDSDACCPLLASDHFAVDISLRKNSVNLACSPAPAHA